MIEFFQTLWKYREVIWYRTVANIRADAKRMYLGFAWWLLEPVAYTIIYYVIFAILLGSKSPGFIGYLLVGTTFWQWFESSISQTIDTITRRASLYQQIAMPKYLFVCIGFLANTWRFICVFFVVNVYILMNGGHLTINLFWLLVVLPIQALFILGLAIPASIAQAYVSDVSHVLRLVFRGGMFLSGIFYSVDKIPEDLKFYFYLNPLACMIQAVRSACIGGTAPNFSHLAYVLILGLCLLWGGIYWHSRISGRILKQIEG